MPTYVAFLRAINLGPVRKFPKDSIIAATQAAGGRDVATYIATGNVRLECDLTSVAAVSAALEAAYAADRDFEVPTMVFTPAELRQVVADLDELWAAHGEPLAHSVTLFQSPPTPESAAAVEALALPDRAFVRGRAAHVLRAGTFTDSALLKSKEFAALGPGTARNDRVIREVTRRWCHP